MHRFSILLAGLVVGCANMGPRSTLDANEGRWEYVEEHGTSKDTAFSKTMEWIAINYNSAKSVIQLNDKETGKIVVKGVTPIVNVIYPEFCDYTMAISVKDEKMKFEFNLGKISQPGSIGYAPKSEMPKIENDFKNIKQQVVAQIQNRKSDDF